MLYASVTDLDAFRYYLTDEDAELERLLAQLRKQEPPSEPMLAGTALHKALEFSADGEFAALEADGYRFTFDDGLAVQLTPFRELKASKRYQVGRTEIAVTGKVDGLYGRRVDDHKATMRFDPERFMAGYQWRFYLDIFDAAHFRWNVFEMSLREPGWYHVFATHRLEQYRYQGMRDDCERLLSRFVEFAAEHLPERFMEKAA